MTASQARITWGWLWSQSVARGRSAVAPTLVTENTEDTSQSHSEWLNANGRKNGRGPSGRHVVGGRWLQLTYALIDIFCVLLSGTIAFALRFAPADLQNPAALGRLWRAGFPAISRYGAFLLIYIALIVLLCEWQDLYRTLRRRSVSEESVAVLKAVLLATLLLTAFIYLSGVKIVSREVVLVTSLLNAFLLVCWRYAKRKIVIHRVERGIGGRNAVIIGAGRIGQALAQQLEQNKLLGYRFKGFLDGNHSTDPRMLGKVEDLGRIARAEFVDEVFITIPSERELVKKVAIEARKYKLYVNVVPDLFDGLGWHAPIRHVGDFPVMDLQWQPLPGFGLGVKRVLDVVLSACGLLLCLPVLVGLAIWVKIDSPGPVLYGSRRVGKKGRVFTCYKLRTMVQNADDLKDSLRHRNEREGPFFKITDDPRITRSGMFLRKYSLDELPQLWNVLKGDMSLVGPRPHPLDDYRQYDLEHLRRLEVKPGITGLWQVTARQDPSFETNMELDLDYIEKWSLWLDIKILTRTLPVVFQGDGQ